MRAFLAAFMLCCLVTLTACDTVLLASAPQTATQPPDDGQFSSLSELDEHMGYPVKSLFTLPAGYIESGWECVGGAAVTTYTSENAGGRIYFYMWDNSMETALFFDTADYTNEVECYAGDNSVVAYGEDDILRLCRWSDESYSYIVYLEVGVDPVIFQMVLDGVT